MRKQTLVLAISMAEDRGQRGQSQTMHLLLCGGGLCQVCSHSVVQRQSHDQVKSQWGMPGNHSKLVEGMNNYKQIDIA